VKIKMKTQVKNVKSKNSRKKDYGLKIVKKEELKDGGNKLTVYDEYTKTLWEVSSVLDKVDERYLSTLLRSKV